MGLFLPVLICFFNVFMWIVLIKKFRKLFSTDGIIASAREELNRMIDDVNRNTAKDLNLLDSKMREAERLVSEAEKRIAVLNSELSQKSQASDFMQVIRGEREEVPAAPSRRPPVEDAREENPPADETPDVKYFSQARNPVEHYVKNSGEVQPAAAHEPPLSQPAENAGVQVQQARSMPSVSFAETPIRPKEAFSDKVRNLFAQGFDVETIAKELDSSTTEVQLIIDMNF